jgi:hypothetical protein
MRLRAAAVRHPGTYIGWFEWIAWGAKSKVKVLILMGDYIVDARAVFAPDVPDNSKSVLRACAVQIAEGGLQWLAAKYEPELRSDVSANHFVIGIAATCPRLGTSPNGVQSLRAETMALRVGWMLRPTCVDGDCGFDCMAHHLGMPRTFAHRAVIRADLAAFIERVAEDPLWQTVFDTCMEALAPMSPPSESPVEDLEAPATPPPVPPPPQPPSAGEDRPAPPSPSESLAAGPKEVAGARPFREWLHTLSAKELNEITKSAAAFQDAESRWRKESGCESGPAEPRRRRIDIKVHQKYATVLAYNKWRAGPGKASTANLKDAARRPRPKP